MFGLTFELGSHTYTGFDKDGHQIAQHDGLGEDPHVGHYELHHTFGFISRPRDPEVDSKGELLSGKSCTVLIGKVGNEEHLWLGSDPRFIPNIPQLKKGGAAFYSAAGSFSVLDGEDGTQTTYVPVPGNKAHVLTTGIDGNDKPFIGIEHANGMAVTMLEHSLVLKNAAGDAYYELNDQGHVISGNLILNGGATIGDPVNAKPAAIAPALLSYLEMLETDISSSLTAILAGVTSNGALGATKFQSTAAARAALKATIAAQKSYIA